jgi:hypothetical protein
MISGNCHRASSVVSHGDPFGRAEKASFSRAHIHLSFGSSECSQINYFNFALTTHQIRQRAEGYSRLTAFAVLRGVTIR